MKILAKFKLWVKRQEGKEGEESVKKEYVRLQCHAAPTPHRSQLSKSFEH